MAIWISEYVSGRQPLPPDRVLLYKDGRGIRCVYVEDEETQLLGGPSSWWEGPIPPEHPEALAIDMQWSYCWEIGGQTFWHSETFTTEDWGLLWGPEGQEMARYFTGNTLLR